MCARHIKFSGPTLRPLGKWIVGCAILALYASFLALGISYGLPGWLQDLGWALSLLLLAVGSVCLLWLSYKHGHMRFDRLGLLPRSWARWVLDESESEERSRPEYRAD